MPRVDGHYVGRRQRNIYLPELLIDKGVPKTNQSVVYRKGDDGTYQTGVEFQYPRFTDNNDGTVTDNATGLMWVADPSEISGVWGTPGSPSTMTWADAIDNSKNLNYAGYDDWRLPCIKELCSLIDYSKSNPAIDSDKFPNTQDGGYWGSSMSQQDCDNVWFPFFSTGRNQWTDDKNAERFSRPVRKAPTGHRFRSHRRGK